MPPGVYTGNGNGSVQLRCLRCGTTFSVFASQADRRSFCSAECRKDYWTIPRVCWQCGTVRPVARSLVNRRMGRFCDRACYAAWEAEQPAALTLAWLYTRILCDLATGCWLWVGVRERHPGDRYGNGRHQGQEFRTHRLSYELHNGPVPPSSNVLHHCDVRACVRPDHLYLGTQADNMRDVWTRNRGLRS